MHHQIIRLSLVAFIVLQYSALTSIAQIKVGFAGGLTSSIIKESGGSFSWSEKARRYSFHAGIRAEKKIGGIMAIRTGIGYASRGTTFIDYTGIMGVSERTDMRIDFIEIPMTFSVQRRGFGIFLGPQYSKLITAKIEEHSMKDIMRGSALDLVYGFGLYPGRVGFEFYLTNGLSNIMKPNYQHVRWRNNSFSFGLYFRVTEAEPVYRRKTSIPHRSLE